MKYLNSKEVSDILGINISTLKRWTDNGTISCHKTAGGHRKFTMQNVREYYRENKEASKNEEVALENFEHKKIFELIKKKGFSELSHKLANSSIESDESTVKTIISGSYMNNIDVETLFDKIIDPGSMIVEKALHENYLSHAEAFISRKIITRATESLNDNMPNGSYNGKSALCVNFEDNLPDLGVVMSEVVLRHKGYNVYNTGSHAELGDLDKVIINKKIDLIVFYLCNMQCCMSVVGDNIMKTADMVASINERANKLEVDVIFGGLGIELLPNIKNTINKTFITFKDLNQLI
ncbi:MAG: helix-turn-helix domain-containing protein [Candidatus Neomarinimicrobiota bacterium]